MQTVREKQKLLWETAPSLINMDTECSTISLLYHRVIKLIYKTILIYRKNLRMQKFKVPLLSSMSSSRECSEGGSRGAWSTATLFWFMIFSFSFGLGFLRRDAVADKLCSWQSPDSVRQTPSWVYVLDRSGKNMQQWCERDQIMSRLELRLEAYIELYIDNTASIIILNYQ